MIADFQRQLGIDASFFPQFLIFLLIFGWLQVVYFRPFLKVIQKRQSQSGGLSEEAAKIEEAAARAELDYQNALIGARKKASLERDRVLAEARAQANEVIGVARQQAKTRLAQARAAALRAAEADLAGLRSQVSGVAALLVEKLTKTSVRL